LGWPAQMFLMSVIGSLVGLFWPMLIALWLDQGKRLGILAPEGGIWSRLGPAFRIGLRILLFFVLSVIIGFITAALGISGFMGNERNQEKLQDLGYLAYFSAFAYGFTAASLVGVPLTRSKDS
jgi:hypothetical protein